MIRTFDEVLATIPHSKTFEINGTQRVHIFSESDRISAAREILAREHDAANPPRRTAKAVMARFARLADTIEAEASAIRSRVGRASTPSQHIMRAEAAALERSARAIRQQIEELEGAS